MSNLLHEKLPAADLLYHYRTFAVALAEEAGQVAVRHFRQVDARRKDDGSLVTAADEALDRLITGRIHAAFPGHGVLSEEQTTTYNPENEYTWVVDPIDGTTNFARGMIIWGVSIGLLQRGVPIAGVIHMPLLQETYAASLGQGATRNGVAIHSDSETAPSDEHLIMQCTRTMRRLQFSTPLKSRMLGSAAYHLTQVAEGVALAGIEFTPKIWDIAAGAVILAEAGALLTLIDGTPIFPLPQEAKEYADYSFPLMTAANLSLQEHITAALNDGATL